ncbi:MAG: FAD-dependent oxidoreductase [Okeania sp. SIO3B3]|nr:FAD-dependent oxidoreductase [Okeania sp. SIO3B3]
MLDVIIVGAGFAGIVAARELQHAGITTLVLEGRDRIGGRTYVAQHQGNSFELGGAYVHWAQPHVWAEITRYGLDIVAEEEEAGETTEVQVFSKGRWRSLDVDKAYELLSEAYETFWGAEAESEVLYESPYQPLSDYWTRYANLTLAEHISNLSLSRVKRDLLCASLLGETNAPLAEASALEMLCQPLLIGAADFERFAEATGEYMIVGGTKALAEHIHADSRAETRYGQVVTRIDQTSEAVTVQTQDGTQYEARAVIVAVPLNTWASIAFTPELNRAKQIVAQQRHVGLGFKCFVRVKGQMPGLLAFAPEPSVFSTVSTKQVNDDDTTWITAFGQLAPESFTVEWAQQAFGSLLPPDSILEVYGHNWTVDPLSLGTWASLRPKQTALVEHLASPEGRLFFAGGDIAFGWRGYIDGAVESGLRTARQVKTLLIAK